MAMMDFKVINTLPAGALAFGKASKIAHVGAMKKVGLQLLNNIINGSPKESVRPPIAKGMLRGSGSVFYQNELIAIAPPVSGKGDPSTSFGGVKNTVAVGFNTAYAWKVHEEYDKTIKGTDFSHRAGGGAKYIEKHLQNDGAEMMQAYADFMRKAL